MRRGFLLALVVALIVVPSASAGTVGTWTPVTPDFNENFNLVGLFRSADGVLHVAAQAHNGANPQHGDFIHVPISPRGDVGNASVIAGDWVGTNSPDIVGNPGGGLLSIWGGIHSTTTGDPLNNGTFAASGDGGNTWSVDPNGPWNGGGTAGGTYVYAEQVSAENAADGTPFETWSHGGIYMHRGLDPNATKYDYNAAIGGETTAIPDLAVDGGTGALWVGWENELGSSGLGVWAQQVDNATGAPVGSPSAMPGSVFNYQGSPESTAILGRTPIASRPGLPGVWMAYPTGYPSATKLLLWKVGDSTSTTLVDTKTVDIHEVALTSAPDGRLTVIWRENGGADRMFARISNPTVTSWGPAFEIPQLKDAAETWAIEASAQTGGLIDVLMNYSEGANGTPMRFWHTQALQPPELAKSVDAKVVSGVVLIKVPGSNAFVPLTHDSNIPVGALVDATNGRVRIVTAVPGGRTQSADFFQGVFQVGQARTGLATMTLAGGNFGACGKAAGAVAAKVQVIRELWGSGKGKFRTKGRFASATIRGTTWQTSDRCDGTLIKVTQGAVTVRDFKARRNVVVTKGHSYLAKKR